MLVFVRLLKYKDNVEILLPFKQLCCWPKYSVHLYCIDEVMEVP